MAAQIQVSLTVPGQQAEIPVTLPEGTDVNQLYNLVAEKTQLTVSQVRIVSRSEGVLEPSEAGSRVVRQGEAFDVVRRTENG